jgi:hypothetical protein
MSDKSAKATKADLFKMLAEAVRNTPGATPIEPIGDVQPAPAAKPKTRPAPKRVAKKKNVRASSVRKQRRR